MSITINKEYFANINFDELIKINSFFSISSDGKSTLMIRNSIVESGTPSFNNVYLSLKCNTKLEVVNQEIGCFHILTCVSDDSAIIQDFKRICQYLFIDKNETKTSDQTIKLFYSLQNIFQTQINKESMRLQIGLYGEFIALLKLCQQNKNEIAQKWHSRSNSKHDIEIDETTRIEIKTTTKQERIHTFRHDQIVRDNIKIYVISNMIEESDEGVPLFKLSLSVISLINDYHKKLLVEELIKQCGLSENYQGFTANLDDCLNNCELYEDKNIPKLNFSSQKGISNIIYDIDFSLVDNSNFNDLKIC